MPANTPNQNYPYPLQTDLIDVAQDLEDLAMAVDDDVHDAVQNLDQKVSVSGDTMTGMLSLPGTTPTSLNHATRKGYVDAEVSSCLPLDGSRSMNAAIDMDGHRIVNLAKPTADTNAARLQDVASALTDAVRKPITTLQYMEGPLASPFFVTLDDSSPSGPNQCTPKRYVDDLVGGFLKTDGTGSGMTGDLAMNNNSITGLPAPTDTGHATNKAYCDAKVKVAGDTMTGDLQIGGDWNAEQPGAVYRDTGHIRTTVTDGEASLVLNRSGAANADGMAFIWFMHDVDAEDGRIHRGATAGNVVYDTTSDMRLKERLSSITDAAVRVQSLARDAFRGRWSEYPDSDPRDMLCAQDIRKVAPYATSGEPNAVNAKGRPKPMMVDYGSLVPLLTAALGNALDRIDALEARLA